MPVIPGVNDGPEALRSTARFLAANGHRSIHCLPYHPLGQAKLARMSDTAEGFSPGPGAGMQVVKTVLEQEGIHAVIYD
jgi:pyruvate-formate lyase-activating enzyme